jgi:hypothetical protein
MNHTQPLTLTHALRNAKDQLIQSQLQIDKIKA